MILYTGAGTNRIAFNARDCRDSLLHNFLMEFLDVLVPILFLSCLLRISNTLAYTTQLHLFGQSEHLNTESSAIQYKLARLNLAS